jgi:hypothetical protein
VNDRSYYCCGFIVDTDMTYKLTEIATSCYALLVMTE